MEYFNCSRCPCWDQSTHITKHKRNYRKLVSKTWLDSSSCGCGIKVGRSPRLHQTTSAIWWVRGGGLINLCVWITQECLSALLSFTCICFLVWLMFQQCLVRSIPHAQQFCQNSDLLTICDNLWSQHFQFLYYVLRLGDRHCRSQYLNDPSDEYWWHALAHFNSFKFAETPIMKMVIQFKSKRHFLCHFFHTITYRSTYLNSFKTK